jgi:hypothetical protein
MTRGTSNDAAGSQARGNGLPRGRAAEGILSELKSRVSRKLPGWTARGLEDPGWVLLEVLAEALAGIREEADGIEERLYPRVLEALGEEPRWAIPARTAVAFSVEEGREEPVLVPARTVVAAPRRPGEPRLGFETTADGWITDARLLRVVSTSGQTAVEVFPHPQMGWDSEPVDLFAGEPSQARHIYVGDPALLLLKDRAGSLVLEWPGSPAILAEGRWEVSVPGGWRALRIEIEETGGGAHARGKGPISRRAARLRIEGPIPDLAEDRIEGTTSPWLRLSLPGRRRLTLQQPAWMAAEIPGAATADLLALPRPPRRLLTQAGGRWEDHSLAADKVSAVDPPADAFPALYLGWDRSTPASVYCALTRRPAPEGWGGTGGERWPRFEWEHSSRRGFRSLEVSDGTRGFTRSGAVSWRMPADWTPQEHFGERLHWLRARWVSGHYASLPCLKAVIPHALEAIEGRTLENHVLEAAVDAAGQADLPLPFAEGEPERFESIEVRTDAGWEQLVHVDVPGGEDEVAPARPARRFALRRGPRGGARIAVDPSLAGAAMWRIPALRIGLGERGNIPAGTLSIIEADIAGLQRAAQPLPAGGGLDAESPESFRARIRAEWKLGNRAVTPRDYERLCRALDPGIARADVSSAPGSAGRVLVTVVPDDPAGPGRLAPERLEWLEELLTEKAPLGVLVMVTEAAYVPIQATVRFRDRPAQVGEAARLAVEERLRKLLHPVRGGPDGRGFPASRWLREGDLAPRMAEAIATVLDGPGGADGKVLVEVSAADGTALPECPVDSAGLLVLPLVFPRLERLRFEEEGER